MKILGLIIMMLVEWLVLMLAMIYTVSTIKGKKMALETARKYVVRRFSMIATLVLIIGYIIANLVGFAKPLMIQVIVLLISIILNAYTLHKNKIIENCIK